MTSEISITTQGSETPVNPARMRCANCGYIFEGILYVCPKCGSNAMDKVNIEESFEHWENEPEWIS